MGFFNGLKEGLTIDSTENTSTLVERSVDPNVYLDKNKSSLRSAGYSSGLPKRGTKELLDAYNNSPNLRRVIKLITADLASTQFYLKPPKSGRRMGRNVNTEADVIYDHPFLDWLYTGNPLLNGRTGLKQSFVYYLLVGECFWTLLGKKRGPPQWWIINPPHWVRDVPKPGKSTYTVQIGNHPVEVPSEFMFWFKDPDPVDPYGRGSGIGTSLADELDGDEYAAKLLKHVLANKGFVDMMVAVSGSNVETLRDLEQVYNNRHRGFWNTGRALFFDADRIEAKTVSQTLNELQLLNFRTWEWDALRETFGVPPELLGKMQNSNRATADTAKSIYGERVLDPLMQEFIAAITPFMSFWPGLEGYELGFESFVPENADYKLEVMKSNPGAFSINDWRVTAGFGEVTWGEEPVSNTPLLPPAQKAVQKSVVRRALTPENTEKLLAAVQTSTIAEGIEPLWHTHLTPIMMEESERLGISFDLINPRMLERAHEVATDRLKDVNETTRKKIAAQLAEGLGKGEGPEQLRMRIEHVFAQAKGYRARAIARTEALRSANLGRSDVWNVTTIPLVKEWVATRDERVRDSHLALDGVSVKLDESFVFNEALEPFVAGSAFVPGVSTAAAHAVNCRCAAAAISPEDATKKSFDADSFWRSHNIILDTWETPAEKQLIKNFDNQETEILSIFDKLV